MNPQAEIPVVTHAEWQFLSPLLDDTYFRRGPRIASLRSTIDAGLYIATTGTAWRRLPSMFGQWNTIYRRLQRMNDERFFDNLCAYLAGYETSQGFQIRLNRSQTKWPDSEDRGATIRKFGSLAGLTLAPKKACGGRPAKSCPATPEVGAERLATNNGVSSRRQWRQRSCGEKVARRSTRAGAWRPAAGSLFAAGHGLGSQMSSGLSSACGVSSIAGPTRSFGRISKISWRTGSPFHYRGDGCSRVST